MKRERERERERGERMKGGNDDACVDKNRVIAVW